jgi:hypothetical protein
VEIRDGWFDASKGNYHAFAVMNRKLASKSLLSSIKLLANRIKSLFNEGVRGATENDFVSAIESGEDLNDAIKKLISGIDLEKNSKFTVVEVQDINEAILAAETWSEKQRKNSTTDSVVLLLDNMGPSNAGIVVAELEKLDLRKWCILEGSGGITKDSIAEWSSSGVDLISTSAMNRGVKPLDISLIIEGEE